MRLISNNKYHSYQIINKYISSQIDHYLRRIDTFLILEIII
jgi:hypothetical protein